MNRACPKFLLLLCSLLLLACSVGLGQAYERVGNQVVQGNARFSVLDDGLIRLEYAPDGAFDDQTTAVITNRRFSEAPYTVVEQADLLEIKTARLTLRYKGSEAFAQNNLMLLWATDGGTATWQPGQQDPLNLGGTRASLDVMNSSNLYPVDPGVLSRSGWFLLDDSNSPLWDPEKQWIIERPQPRGQDWYFFCYGLDYAQGLRWYTQLCGPIPVPPKFAFGAWYSRYWPFTQAEEEGIVKRFQELDIPLDVLVSDVDWHLYGWTGYDWNRDLFPDPAGFIDFLRQNQVKLTFNDHPGFLSNQDSHYQAYVNAANPELTGDGARVNQAVKAQSEAFFDVVQHDLLDQGMGFTWIDGCAAGMDGLNCFLWTNRCYYLDTQQHTGKRGLIFSRYGGLGTHRYPLGFSGDTFSEWGVLEYEVPFTAKAGNVGYAYWSHDIGGFMGNKIDTELYLRWVQFGVFSPVLRLHSNHGVREPWEYGSKALRITRDYFQWRHRLAPYLYSLAHEAFLTSKPLCRPMYLEYPTLSEAYANPQQYLLGANLLVAPITRPAGAEGYATQTVWLPPGLWYDYWTEEAYEGPQTLLYRADISTIPLFVKAGALLPTQPVTQTLEEATGRELTLDAWLGKAGDFTLYEDDGKTLAYQEGFYARTPFEVRLEAGTATVKLGPTTGKYEGAPQERVYTLRLHGVMKPGEVRLGGKSLAQSETAPGWQHDAGKWILTVRLPEQAVAKGATLTVSGLPDEARLSRLLQLRQYASRTERAANQLDRSGGPAELARQLTDGAAQVKAKLWRAAQTGANSEELGQLLSDAEKTYADLWPAVVKNSSYADIQSELLKLIFGVSLTMDLTPAEGNRLKVAGSLTLPSALKGATYRLRLKEPQGWKLEPVAGTAQLNLMLTPPSQLPVAEVPVVIEAEITFHKAVATLSQSTSIDFSWLQPVKALGVFKSGGFGDAADPLPPDTDFELGKRYATETGEALWVEAPWILPTGETVPRFNFNDYFGQYEKGIAYAAAQVVSDREQEALLLLGTDDGCQIYLNGELVHQALPPREAKTDEDRVRVHLRQGNNLFVAKVANNYHQWLLVWRLRAPESGSLTGVTSLR